MITKPLLILAFNRPGHVKRLVDSLRPHMPQKLLVSVDGPRQGNKQDAEKISRVLEEIKKIDWTTDIEFKIQEKNLGLRFAVAEAVTWVINKYGEVIVVEDDIEVGPEFLSFMNLMLDEFRHDETIGHISGYNLVPQHVLECPNKLARLSKIPESYAWATWERSWKLYQPSADNLRSFTIPKLLKICGTLLSSLVWKINFLDAAKDNINTWAYRWLAALWISELNCISPNRNLVKYCGSADGTHTTLRSRVVEQPISELSGAMSHLGLEFDSSADAWINKRIFHATPFGITSRLLQSTILNWIRIYRTLRKKMRFANAD